MQITKYFVIGLIILSNFSLASQIKEVTSEPFPAIITTDYEYDPYPTEENPLRGFFPYRDEYDSFPHSMEFFYIPLKYLMSDFDTYTFGDYLEPWLDDIVSREHQAIFRVFLDYPDEETGIPDFLLNVIDTYEYDEYGGGISPDYTNEVLLSTLEGLIEELGTNYDGDNRIAFLQIGILGHWGEWHTYPREDLFPNATIQDRILTAFDNAFNITKILARYPTTETVTKDLGYHDDSFAYETIGPDLWEFYNRLETFSETERWKTNPIGGEVYPSLQDDLWDDYPPSNLEDFTTCVNTTHVSWLLNQKQFDIRFSNKKMERARLGALSMGYQFHLEEATAIKNDTSINLTLKLKNTGNAPFYYPLYLEVGINDSYIQHINHTAKLLVNINPGETQNYQFSLPEELVTNESSICFKLSSPYVIDEIAFANYETNQDGSLNLRPKEVIPTEESEVHIVYYFTILVTICISMYRIKRKRRKN